MSDLTNLLAQLEVPEHGVDFWSRLETQLGDAGTGPRIAEPAVDTEITTDAHTVADLEEHRRTRRWAIAAVTAVAAVILAIVVTSGILTDDTAPGPVITDPEPDDPELVPDDPEPDDPEPEPDPEPPPTSTLPSQPGPATAAAAMAPFPQPSGYATAVDGTTDQPWTEQYEFTLYGPTESTAPVRGTLLVGSGPANVTPDLMTVVTDFAFEAVVRAPITIYQGFDLEVILTSKTMSEEELAQVAESVTIENGEARIILPPELVELSRGRYASRTALINNQNLLRYTYASERRPSGAQWWTADDPRPTGTIYVWASQAQPYALDLIGMFGSNPRRIEVGDNQGIIADYPYHDGTEMLSYVDEDGIVVTVLASDPSIDLTEFVEAQSPGESFAPPDPLPYSYDNPVLRGNDLGLEWLIFPKLDTETSGISVCTSWQPEEAEEDVFAPNLACSTSGFGHVGSSTNGFFIDEPLRHDGKAWLLYLGRAPDCAAAVEAWTEVEAIASVDTLVAEDGHRYFALPVPLGEPDVSEPDGWFGGFTLVAVDGSGGFVDSTFASGWSVHC